jgi:hypothetical protein
MPALPAGIGIVDAAVHPLCEIVVHMRDAEGHELAVDEGQAALAGFGIVADGREGSVGGTQPGPALRPPRRRVRLSWRYAKSKSS